VDSSVRLVSQPDPTGESPVTTAKPLARYSAVEGALASGFATAELHHQVGHDPSQKYLLRSLLSSQRISTGSKMAGSLNTEWSS
jgi:hypothetical protein